jgi:hypothetical protein
MKNFNITMKKTIFALTFVSLLASCQKDDLKTTEYTTPSTSTKSGIVGQWEISYYMPAIKETFVDTVTFDSTTYSHSIYFLKNDKYAYSLKNANTIVFEAHKYDMLVGDYNREVTSTFNFVSNDKMVIDKFGEESDITTDCPDHSCRTDVTFKRIY